MSGKSMKLIIGLVVAIAAIVAGLWGINAYTNSLHKAESDLDAPAASAPHGTAKKK